MPGTGVFDAVSEGTAQLYHAVPAYWGSKSKGILLFGSQPFGLSADEQLGWMVHGGGQALYDEMYGRFNIKPFLCGNSGPQWAGWFKNEIASVEDLRGLRFRTTGIASQMCAKLGMAAEAMSGPAMFQALQTGALDAGEFIGPWTDSALGYYQVAPYYYWPGVGEPSSAEECGVNAEAYAELPDDLKEVVAQACQGLYGQVLTEYMTKHAQSLQTLVARTRCSGPQASRRRDRRHGGCSTGNLRGIPRRQRRAGGADHRKLHRVSRYRGRLHDLCRQRPDERPRGRLRVLM